MGAKRGISAGGSRWGSHGSAFFLFPKGVTKLKYVMFHQQLQCLHQGGEREVRELALIGNDVVMDGLDGSISIDVSTHQGRISGEQAAISRQLQGFKICKQIKRALDVAVKGAGNVLQMSVDPDTQRMEQAPRE